jgi:formylmethanofuran dehydrogenase subunit E
MLIGQIKEAGHGMLSIQHVRVEPDKLARPRLGKVTICPSCGEAYPIKDGDRCRACVGESPYVD